MDCINNRTITEEILEACLYSVNKRAKNHRDRAREAEYRYRYDYYGVGINERMKMEEMYNMKDTMLETLSPVCAHYVERDYKVPSEAPYDCCETYDSYKECYLLYKVGWIFCFVRATIPVLGEPVFRLALIHFDFA